MMTEIDRPSPSHRKDVREAQKRLMKAASTAAFFGLEPTHLFISEWFAQRDPNKQYHG